MNRWLKAIWSRPKPESANHLDVGANANPSPDLETPLLDLKEFESSSIARDISAYLVGQQQASFIQIVRPGLPLSETEFQRGYYRAVTHMKSIATILVQMKEEQIREAQFKIDKEVNDERTDSNPTIE